MKDEVSLFIDKYDRLCERMAGGQRYRPIYSKEEAENNSSTFVDYNQGQYQYGGCDRGNCSISVETPTLDECMFHAIKGAAFDLALDYELKHRVENQDFRIIFFRKMIQYMKQINRGWAIRLESELSEIARSDGFSVTNKETKKTVFLSYLLGFVGIGLALMPWMYFEIRGWGSYVITCIGALLAGISRADSLSVLPGRGNTNGKFLRDSGSRLKNRISKLKQK